MNSTASCQPQPTAADAQQTSLHMSSPIVDIETNETTRTEIVQLIISWLIKEGMTSSAQLLREEATAHLRDGHYQRKTVRAICRSVEERNWDSAQKYLKRLQDKSRPKGMPAPSSSSAGGGGGGGGVGVSSGGSEAMQAPSQLRTLVRALPFLLAQQQYLELVDEDDGQRAFAFFMRSVKPFESSISREDFQKLNYLLTCKAVREGAAQYPEYRGWTPELGRARLLHYIEGTMGSTTAMPYLRQGNVVLSENSLPRPLEVMLAESLSYEIVSHQHPHLTQRGGANRQVSIASLRTPLIDQLPPTEPFMAVDVNLLVRSQFPSLVSNMAEHTAIRINACQLFLEDACSLVVSVQTQRGPSSIISIPLQPQSQAGGGLPCPIPTFTSSSIAEEAALLYEHKSAVRGMRRHLSQLLVWGGCEAVVLGLNLANSSEVRANSPQRCNNNSCVKVTYAHDAEVLSSCFFPCGSIVATGLSDGTVTLWDTLTSDKMLTANYGGAGIVSVITNYTGTQYIAASKDGTVRIADVATGVLLHALISPITLEVSSIALSPSAALLATSYRGGMVRLWDVLTGNLLPFMLSGSENNSRTSLPLAFGHNDHHVLCASDDGCLYTWDMSKADSNANGVAVQAGGNGSAEGVSRWRPGVLVQPSLRLPLHRACVTDVKVEGSYVASCGDDGLVYICTTTANTGSKLV